MTKLVFLYLPILFLITGSGHAQDLNVNVPLVTDPTAIPDNLRRENLVAWCIVPFDAKKRGPEQRAKMLVELGLKKCAYDWREEHVATFAEEFATYEGIWH